MYSSRSNEGGEDDYDFNYSLDLNTSNAPPGTSSGYAFGSKAPRMSTAMNPGAGAGGGGGQPASRMGTASQGGGEARPMTSVSGAGFSSKQGAAGRGTFDPLNQGRGAAPSLAEKADNSAEDLAKEMEKQVHTLIEESAQCSEGHEFTKALEKAKVRE